MERIVDNLNKYSKAPKTHEKYEYSEQKSQIVKNRKTKKYDYYICDYCGEEIVIEKDKTKMTGGIVQIPKTLSKVNKTINLALCNKCVKPVINQLEKR